MCVKCGEDPDLKPCSFLVNGSNNQIVIQKGDNNQCGAIRGKAYEALLKENQALRELVEMWKSIALD